MTLNSQRELAQDPITSEPSPQQFVVYPDAALGGLCA
jgi:hypothetical protein